MITMINCKTTKTYECVHDKSTIKWCAWTEDIKKTRWNYPQNWTLCAQFVNGTSSRALSSDSLNFILYIHMHKHTLTACSFTLDIGIVIIFGLCTTEKTKQNITKSSEKTNQGQNKITLNKKPKNQKIQTPTDHLKHGKIICTSNTISTMITLCI